MTRCTVWQYAGARLINSVYGQFWQCSIPNARILKVIAILPSFISNTKRSEIPIQSHPVHLNSFGHLSQSVCGSLWLSVISAVLEASLMPLLQLGDRLFNIADHPHLISGEYMCSYLPSGQLNALSNSWAIPTHYSMQSPHSSVEHVIVFTRLQYSWQCGCTL